METLKYLNHPGLFGNLGEEFQCSPAIWGVGGVIINRWRLWWGCMSACLLYPDVHGALGVISANAAPMLKHHDAAVANHMYTRPKKPVLMHPESIKHAACRQIQEAGGKLITPADCATTMKGPAHGGTAILAAQAAGMRACERARLEPEEHALLQSTRFADALIAYGQGNQWAHVCSWECLPNSHGDERTAADFTALQTANKDMEATLMLRDRHCGQPCITGTDPNRGVHPPSIITPTGNAIRSAARCRKRGHNAQRT